MKAKDYRAQLEAELAAERFEEEQVLELVEVHQILANKSSTTATRASALGRCEFGDDEFDEWVSTCLSVLNDESERVAVRMAALDQLKSLVFMAELFEPHHASFRESLQRVALSKSSTMRFSALEYLSHDGDGFAAAQLMAGLRGESPLLVSQEDAIRFVGEDEHTDIAELLRDQFDQLSAAAKLEAAQVLGADPRSAPMMAEVAADKRNAKALRLACLSSVQNSDPQQYQSMAERLVLDEEEINDVRAAALSGLAASNLSDSARKNQNFTERVKNLKSRSRNVHSAKRQYLKSS